MFMRIPFNRRYLNFKLILKRMQENVSRCVWTMYLCVFVCVFVCVDSNIVES